MKLEDIVIAQKFGASPLLCISWLQEETARRQSLIDKHRVKATCASSSALLRSGFIYVRAVA
jgi:hypothetical protein